VSFIYRGDEVAAQAASGAIRYDIKRETTHGRWYLDASWQTASVLVLTPADLRLTPVLAVDLNRGHLAAWTVTPDGNPAGPPVTIPLDLAGLPATIRDGRICGAISTLIRLARQRGCRAVVIENLDFTDARARTRACGRPPVTRPTRASLPTAHLRHPHRKV